MHLDLAYSLVFLLAAVFVVTFFKRFKSSAILGYLVSGALIGPHITGIIENPEKIRSLGEVGVLFLLFTIGLELPYERLRILRNYIFGFGFAQVLITSVFFTVLCYVLGISAKSAAIIGIGLAFSSTAVVLQVLAERNELTTRFGRVAFAILLFQDFVVVLLLVCLSALTTMEGSLWLAFSHAGLKAVVVVTILAMFGRFILRPLYRSITALNDDDLLMATTLILVLGTSLFTQYGGLSLELGAFLAGLILATTEYRHQVEADIKPFRGLLLGLFFMTVGMSIDLKLLRNDTAIVMGWLLVAMISKILVTLPLAWWFGLSKKSSLRLSLLIGSGGEFIFILLTPAAAMGLISSEFKDILFLTTVLSMALTPILNMLGDKLCNFLGYEGMALQQDNEAVKDHVIIIGFSEIGENLSLLLQKNLIPFSALDHNMNCVMEARAKGYPVFFGDAKRLSVLKAIGADRAKVIVLAMEKHNIAAKIALMIRRNFPDTAVCLRANDKENSVKLKQAGINVLFFDKIDETLQMGQIVLQSLNLAKDEVVKMVEELRTQQEIT